ISRVAQRQDDLRLRIARDELTPEQASRRVRHGPIATEQRLPVAELARGSSAPQCMLLRMLEHFVHVMTGPKPELDQRLAQRKRAGSREACTDDAQRLVSRSRVRRHYHLFQGGLPLAHRSSR